MLYYSKKQIILFITIFFALSLFLAGDAYAANWYVDSGVSSSGNGQSWGTAWKNFSNITGLSAGDTVYISGGPSGSTKTYTLGGSWTPIGGTAGSPITYQIGQDSQHNGTAFFSGSGVWIGGQVSNIVVSGDAGDGNMHFSIADPSTGVSPWYQIMNYTNSGKVNVRLSYINFGQISGPSKSQVLRAAGITGFEFDHSYVYVTNPIVDAFAYIQCSDSAWDTCKIHHNTLDIPRGTSGMGADAIQGCATGCSIYNNLFQTHAGYTGSQHNDGWQPLAGVRSKAYNNIFKDFVSYAIYIDPVYGLNVSSIYIYNNIIMIDPLLVTGSGMGITISAERTGMSYNDLIIANNIIINYAGTNSIWMNNATGGYTNCTVANNALVNGSATNISASVTTVDNVAVTSAQAANYFTQYTIDGGLDNDYHLESTATSLIDQATSLSSYFTADKDGIARSSAWDIGAYEYLSSTQPPPSATSTYEAESCSLIAPMQIVSDSSASGGQYIQTSTSESGTATCSFSVSQADTYKITARVFSPNGGTDSFYFQTDNSPEDIWDLNPTASPSEYNVWREDNLAKRGTGTFDNPQYDPYTINLSSGVHTLALRGRESNARLDYFYLTRVADIAPPSAPSGLVVQ